MTGAFLLGIERSAAARFSFVLSIPAVGGAGLYELWKERHDLLATGHVAGLTLGTIVAGVTGFLSIAALLRFLRTRTLLPFVAYRAVLSLLLVLLIAKGTLSSS